jgi:hypothetical protein
MLTPRERMLVDRFLSYRYPARSASPERLLRDWQRLVEHVESGYGHLYEEYTNELGVRDSLEDVASIVSPSSQDKVRVAVRPWDDRFERATAFTQEPIFRQRLCEPARWWWYRIPKRANDSFLRQLEATAMRYAKERSRQPGGGAGD